MLDDDRFIVETIDNWCFGHENTGNIMKQENIQSIWEEVKKIEPISLVTGDGSISCIDSPNEQEENTACFHFCEIVCGLGCLEKGGDLVVKMFTVFEHSYQNLCSTGSFICRIHDTWTPFSVGTLYLLNKCFESISIIKPSTSCAYTGEKFLVCRGYYGFNSQLY